MRTAQFGKRALPLKKRAASEENLVWDKDFHNKLQWKHKVVNQQDNAGWYRSVLCALMSSTSDESADHEWKKEEFERSHMAQDKHTVPGPGACTHDVHLHLHVHMHM